MIIAELLKLGFQDTSECPAAWQDKGQVLCRHFGRTLISILWHPDSAHLEVLVGNVQTPMLYFRADSLSLAQLQETLREYWWAT